MESDLKPSKMNIKISPYTIVPAKHWADRTDENYFFNQDDDEQDLHIRNLQLNNQKTPQGVWAFYFTFAGEIIRIWGDKHLEL